MLESDRFYDAIAADYARWSRSRERYLQAVDAIVVAQAPHAARMLDVGSGDGVRACALAARIDATELTLLDSSGEMHARSTAITGARGVHADITDPTLGLSERFDLVSCLGNVLGHVGDRARRRSALANLAPLLAPGGRLILDVHNRWNVRSYGWRAVRNIVLGSGERRGDFRLVPSFSAPVATVVHLFAPGELDHGFAEAGLRVLSRYVIDYQTGSRRRSVLGGQLVYALAGTEVPPG